MEDMVTVAEVIDLMLTSVKNVITQNSSIEKRVLGFERLCFQNPLVNQSNVKNVEK